MVYGLYKLNVVCTARKNKSHKPGNTALSKSDTRGFPDASNDGCGGETVNMWRVENEDGLDKSNSFKYDPGLLCMWYVYVVLNWICVQYF